ncbi:MAG: amidase, partial [Rhodospirillales bacterium]|nr:amidase [Rhodospirillales bacterium]
MPDPLWSLSATRLADLYRRGAATPTQVLEAVLGRLETVNKQLNAVVASDVAAARDAAAAATARWTAAAPLSPLDGLPFTV